VAQQGGFEVPGEEAEEEEDAGAAEEIPCDPVDGEFCAESESRGSRVEGRRYTDGRWNVDQMSVRPWVAQKLFLCRIRTQTTSPAA
jgi:hypothetical protein